MKKRNFFQSMFAAAAILFSSVTMAASGFYDVVIKNPDGALAALKITTLSTGTVSTLNPGESGQFPVEYMHSVSVVSLDTTGSPAAVLVRKLATSDLHTLWARSLYMADAAAVDYTFSSYIVGGAVDGSALLLWTQDLPCSNGTC